jgi:hypothetical protein
MGLASQRLQSVIMWGTACGLGRGEESCLQWDATLGTRRSGQSETVYTWTAT